MNQMDKCMFVCSYCDIENNEFSEMYNHLLNVHQGEIFKFKKLKLCEKNRFLRLHYNKLQFSSN